MSAALPGATTYHKYGQVDGYLHDVGIVSGPNHPFVIAVVTKGADGTDYEKRSKVIRQIVQAASAALQ